MRQLLGEPDQVDDDYYRTDHFLLYDLAMARPDDLPASYPAAGGCGRRYCRPRFAVGIDVEGRVVSTAYLP